MCLLTVNVALKKPAYQQYPYTYGIKDKFDVSNAVDGRKTDLSGAGGQCAISCGRQTTTWWVDLTSIHSIHHITIYFRTENHGIFTAIVHLENDSKNCLEISSFVFLC